MSNASITERQLRDPGVFPSLGAALLFLRRGWGGPRVYGGRALNMEMALIDPTPKARLQCVNPSGLNALVFRSTNNTERIIYWGNCSVFLLVPCECPDPFCEYYSSVLIPFIIHRINCPSKWGGTNCRPYFEGPEAPVLPLKFVTHQQSWSVLFNGWFIAMTRCSEGLVLDEHSPVNRRIEQPLPFKWHGIVLFQSSDAV